MVAKQGKCIINNYPRSGHCKNPFKHLNKIIMEKKNQVKQSNLRPVATEIIKEALDKYYRTVNVGEWTATNIWFLALAHGVSGEIYDGIDSPISIKRFGKKGAGLSVMLWSGLNNIYGVDIFTENDNATIKTIYCLDYVEKRATEVGSHEELVAWLMSKFDHEVMPLN